MNDIEYRQFNYRQMMQLKTHLARWLYKRLAYYYSNAGHTAPIRLSFARMRDESGMLDRVRTNDAIKELEAVFEVFKTIRVFNSVQRIKDISRLSILSTPASRINSLSQRVYNIASNCYI
ncbi:hypothetical protein KEF85_12895 [Methylomonas paludis]|uniref:Uncharacterized protein n=1 Tax=Methylomonas paludis TaxID=1173101 RepID=A0A975R8P3_9GAMM|nr:hypothetical protein [Methylomonas paludis]QWF70232.1 hypothetical protein KEF85_12895 [Methylomonas paludis]